MHSFQLKFLRKGISRTEKGRRKFEEKLGENRDIFRKGEKLFLPYTFYSIRNEMINLSKKIRNRLNDKQAKLSERKKPLWIGSRNNVVKLNGVELPKLVLDVLPLGPKHPVSDKLIEVHFLVDVDRLFCYLRWWKVVWFSRSYVKKTLVVKRYAKNVRDTPMDRTIKKIKTSW